jgi:hypothetical protein
MSTVVYLSVGKVRMLGEHNKIESTSSEKISVSSNKIKAEYKQYSSNTNLGYRLLKPLKMLCIILTELNGWGCR